MASESDSAVDISTDSAYITAPCGETAAERSSFLSVFDVYDIAAAIGKEFESIIDKHGSDSVCNLMPKVIHILEELEDYASRLESQDGEILALQAAVDRIELDRLSHAQDRLRCEQEMLKLEQTWQAEAAEFRQIIQRLKDENMFLIRALNAAKVSDECPYSEVSVAMLKLVSETAGEEVRLMLRLKEVIDRQRIEIRALKRQLAQTSIDLDAVSWSILLALNCTCRRFCLGAQADIQQQANRLAKLNAVLRRKHGVSKRQAAQLAEDKLLNTEGKMILDVPNSSRPRFTVDELRNALIERNELKSRIVEVEEELSVYSRAGDQDPPVQGPINREPDEKLYFDQHRSSSGIQKL
ncbi:unnamed protein product [Dibothriocephalus latus]|uniref:RH1 domain-containing protein n=1 Tax=Dibothriocephalus latus TaxID=60516 RepID=A0A3P7P0K6_DIBLA|nr:unnamed protein product [Dibothriocephalus latus]